MEKIRPAMVERGFIDEIVKHYESLMLKDNEILCPFCHGTQILAKKDFKPCPHCNDGKVKICKFCKQPIDKIQGHYCRGMRDEDEKTEKKKEQEQLDKAKEIPYCEAEKEECFYSSMFTENDGFFTAMTDFMEDWENNHKGEEKPEYAFCTKKDVPYIDASDVTEEFVIENSYDGASDDLDAGEVKKLQSALNTFCADCGVGATYYKDTSRKARIPWT